MPCGSKEASLAQGILKRDLRLAWHMPPLLSRGIPGDPVERCLPWESPRRRRKPEADLISADPNEKVAGVGRIVFLNQPLAVVDHLRPHRQGKRFPTLPRSAFFRSWRLHHIRLLAASDPTQIGQMRSFHRFGSARSLPPHNATDQGPRDAFLLRRSRTSMLRNTSARLISGLILNTGLEQIIDLC